MLLLLLGCGTETDTAADACADAPVVTWDNFGQALLVEHCQPCHASTATERFGAPEEVSFDTEDDVIEHRQLILDVATGDDWTMPPVVEIGETDRELLWIWLTCYETDEAAPA
jgi:uncharacterized membrane protein